MEEVQRLLASFVRESGNAVNSNVLVASLATLESQYANQAAAIVSRGNKLDSGMQVTRV